MPLRSHSDDPNWSQDYDAKLSKAYKDEYGFTAHLLGRLALQWFDKFSFNSPANERRVTFSRVQFIEYGNMEMGQIVQILIHRVLQDQPRIFILLRPTIRRNTRDPATGQELVEYDNTRDLQFVGLSRISPKQHMLCRTALYHRDGSWPRI